MELNGVNSAYAAYQAKNETVNNKTSDKNNKKDEKVTSKTSSTSDVSAVYESSISKTDAKTAKNAAIVAQLKADSEKRFNQMQSLVTDMFKKQGITIANADEMWKALAKGDFTADEDTINQAKEDISEDGYWGVNQTSERIFSFALALSNGDDKKMQEMVKAVEKGFSEATNAWGRDLPQISSDTHNAIMDKFDNWFKENGSSATTKDLLA